MSRLKFEELNLSEALMNAVKDMGFEEASPIQAEAIPLIMEGKDIIGQAQTGTGKTAAFAIPVIEKLNPESKDVQAVILCPTRELVIQVSEEFRKLMKYRNNLYVAPVYGGQEIERQLRTLKKGVQVIIGTPGRMMDHMRRRSIDMSSVNIVVLDEADEMLDMGFREDIEFILKDTPQSRQTVLFSATMADDILGLTKKFQKAPVVINVTHKKLNAPKINQVYIEVQEKNKPELLARLLDLHNVKLGLVFCNTKSKVDELVEILKVRGYFADALHGDMSQNQRDRVMNGFRNGTVEILVATDVAGRGIDVNDIEAVFNYDLPRDDEDYIHRIGRTARAGKQGTAFSFIVGKEIYNLTRIQRNNGFPIIRQTPPTLDELEATRINAYSTKITDIIESGNLRRYISQIESVMGEEYTSLDVAAALLKIMIEKENKGFDGTINFEKPLEDHKQDNNSRNRRGRRDNKFDNKFSFDGPKSRRQNKFPKKQESNEQSTPFGNSFKEDEWKNKPERKKRSGFKSNSESSFGSDKFEKPFPKKQKSQDQGSSFGNSSQGEWKNKPEKKKHSGFGSNAGGSFGKDKFDKPFPKKQNSENRSFRKKK